MAHHARCRGLRADSGRRRRPALPAQGNYSFSEPMDERKRLGAPSPRMLARRGPAQQPETRRVTLRPCLSCICRLRTNLPYAQGPPATQGTPKVTFMRASLPEEPPQPALRPSKSSACSASAPGPRPRMVNAEISLRALKTSSSRVLQFFFAKTTTAERGACEEVQSA